MSMERCDVRDATHVQLADRSVEKITEKWGVNEDGTLARVGEGGFGVVTETGKRVDMWHARLYFRETEITAAPPLRDAAVSVFLEGAQTEESPMPSGVAKDPKAALAKRLKTRAARMRAIEAGDLKKGEPWTAELAAKYGIEDKAGNYKPSRKPRKMATRKERDYSAEHVRRKAQKQRDRDALALIYGKQPRQARAAAARAIKKTRQPKAKGAAGLPAELPYHDGNRIIIIVPMEVPWGVVYVPKP